MKFNSWFPNGLSLTFRANFCICDPHKKKEEKSILFPFIFIFTDFLHNHFLLVTAIFFNNGNFAFSSSVIILGMGFSRQQKGQVRDIFMTWQTLKWNFHFFSWLSLESPSSQFTLMMMWDMWKQYLAKLWKGSPKEKVYKKMFGFREKGFKGNPPWNWRILL